MSEQNGHKNSLSEYVKLAAAVTAVIGLLSGAVGLVGGRLPPWASYREFKELEAKVNAQYNNDLVQLCIDWNRRWRNAYMRYQEMGSEVDKDIMNEAELRIRQIANCTFERRF